MTIWVNNFSDSQRPLFLLRSLSHPLFFFPVAILLIMMGLTSYAEYKAEEYNESIRFILNDQIPQLQDEMESSLIVTRKALEEYSNNGRTPELLEKFKKDFEISHGKMEIIQNYFSEDLKEAEEHEKGVVPFSPVSKAMREVGDDINAMPPGDEKVAVTILEKLNNLAESLQYFEANTTRIHNDEARKLLMMMREKDFQRIIFLAFTWISSLVLIIFLLHNALVYRRKSEAAHKAEQNNALFAAALQSTQAGVMIRDLQKEDTPIVFSNNALTNITGYTFEDIKRKPLSFLFGPLTSQEKAMGMRQSFFERRHFVSDILIYRKDGVPFWSEFSISPVFNTEGQISHIIAMVLDISSLRETQEALMLAKEEAEKAVSIKGHFLAAMSHELRTPINGILGVLDLLSDITLEEEQIKLVEIAKTSGKRLLEIVNDILDYSKIEAGKFEVEIAPFSLSQMVKEAIDLVKPLADTKKLPIKLSIAENTPDFLESDGGRIRQVLLNLISNSIKFTETGSIELKIFCLLDGAGQGTALIRFEVIDTGLGIGVADQDKLFNEFTQVDRPFSRRFEGTGLGLAISKQLIKLLGGEIGVESRIGQGSKFWFMLPLKSATAPATTKSERSEAARPAHEAPKFSARVLVAEDNPVNQLVANRYLQKAGCMVDVANNGAEAVEKFKTTEYDMILMDVSMPEMDGLEATRMIRSIEGSVPKIPIVALTAHAMRGDREQCIAVGMNDYLSKPLSYDIMVKALERWLPTPIPDDPSPVLKEERYQEASPEKAPRQAAPIAKEQNPSSSTPPSGDMPVIFEPAAIETLANDLDIETMLRIANVFLEDMEKRFGVLKEALSKGVAAEISDAAHALKSSSANCGLLRFSDLMKQVEMAGKNNDIAIARNLAESLDYCYIASREALSAGLEKYKK